MTTLKYGIDGYIKWSRFYNGPANGPDTAIAAVTDHCGNVYVAGATTGIGTGLDYTLLKYDSEGNLLWDVRYVPEGNTNDVPLAMAIDEDASIYLTGTRFPSTGPSEILTVAWSANGELLWSDIYDQAVATGARAQDLAIGADHSVHVTGYGYFTGSSTDWVTIKYASIPCDCASHGDVVGNDGFIDVMDVVGLIEHVLVTPATLTVDPNCPHLDRGDINCDGIENILDVVSMIDFVYRGGPPPCDPCLLPYG